MSPNKNSEILSTGSKTRLGFLMKSVDIPRVARESPRLTSVANSAFTVRNTRAPLGKSLGEARKFALLNSEPGTFIRAVLCC